MSGFGGLRVEISVDTLAGALAVDALGADRIELCAAALDGGLTPSHGVIAAAVRECTRAAVHVLVRPRGGDFCYTTGEIDAMVADVAHAVELGATGVVSGVLAEGGIVHPATAELVAAAGDREFTFHRAIDVCADPLAALDVLGGLGVRRVLTSGCASTAAQGTAVIADLVRRADGVAVMAGGGVRPDNVRGLVRATGVRDVHAAPRRPVRGQPIHHRRRLHQWLTAGRLRPLRTRHRRRGAPVRLPLIRHPRMPVQARSQHEDVGQERGGRPLRGHPEFNFQDGRHGAFHESSPSGHRAARKQAGAARRELSPPGWPRGRGRTSGGPWAAARNRYRRAGPAVSASVRGCRGRARRPAGARSC